MSLVRRVLESDAAVLLSFAFFLVGSVQKSQKDVNAVFAFLIAFAVVALYVSHSLTHRLVAHWRMLPLMIGFGLQHIHSSEECALMYIIPAFVTVILVFILPVSPPAVLIGKYTCIGTTSFNISNTESDDHCMHNIPVQCWFPMKEKKKTSTSPPKAMLWTSGNPMEQEREIFALLNAIAQNQRLPSFLLKHLALTRSNSIFCHDLTDLSDTEKIYPVIIYSHGMYGWRQIHHTACEKLASEGFVVFAMDHKPDSTLARPYKDSDGNRSFDFNTPSGSTLKQDHSFHAEGINRRKRQILTLLQFLPSTSTRLDLSSVFYFGHSFGGGTCASVACTQKEGVKGVIVLDGWFYPLDSLTRKEGSNAPMLMLSSHKWPSAKWQCPYRLELCESSKNKSKLVIDMILTESNHQNFCDSHYIASHFLMKGGALLGKADNPKDVIDAIDACIVGFFKYCLLYDGGTEFHDFEKSSINLEYFAATYYLSEHAQTSGKISAKRIRQHITYLQTRSKSSVELKKLQPLQCSAELESDIGDTLIYDDSYFNKTKDW